MLDYNADHFCPVYDRIITADLCYDSLCCLSGEFKISSTKELLEVKDIEKAINASDIGLPPLNDGTVVRITMPVLTEETRKGFCKDIAKYGEETKVAIRNIRRDANDEIKKDKTLPEDTAKDLQDQVQKLTDKFVEKTDAVAKAKEKEVMTI